MSSAVFPTLAGIGWDINRTETWKTTVQENVSGKETRVALWTFPRREWGLTYDFLRQGVVNGSAFTEFSQLAGFFNQRQGKFDSFLYTDSDDSSVTGQAIGTGDGSTTTFQLVRAFGGFVEPILAPNAVSHVYNNGVDAGGWSVSSWGSATPGVITYSVAPIAGHTITADFTYFWPVRFTEDTMSFAKFMQSLWNGKSVKLISLKN